ncbi:MAG: hypothetical protein ABI718_06665 [Acidobacteriota bacterium]
MFVIPSLLLVTTLLKPVDTLVLRTGERLAVAGEVTIDGDQAIFRHPNGALYSLPVRELDLPATRDLAWRKAQPEQKAVPDEVVSKSLPIREEQKRKLLGDLQSSHSPNPSPVRGFTAGPPAIPTEAEEEQVRRAEWEWRDRSRSFSEGVRRAREDLQLLLDKQEQLENEVLGLASLGYRTDQFSYQILQLQVTRDQIPRARLEVERSQRAQDQFRDDARRQGILPGWLR